jgi:hypothetical protein
MTLFRTPTIAAAALVTMALLAGPPASAQTQPQGMTVGSPPPPSGGAKPSKKAMRAKCQAEAKEKGLKGKAMRSHVTTCMKG